MAFTPLLATAAEVAIFTKAFIQADFGLGDTDWATFKVIIHEMAEETILEYMNRTDLVAGDLTADTGLASILKFATCQLITQTYLYIKQSAAGAIININDLTLEVILPAMFNKHIKAILRSKRIFMFGAIDPDADYD